MTTEKYPISKELKRMRIAVTLFYFCMGFCFATWASRIPDIKDKIGLSDGQLGSILFALPLGQLVTMPFSGMLVTRFGSRIMALIGISLYAVMMTNMGLAGTPHQLFLALFLFGMCGNMGNIAINTQGVMAEKEYYPHPIMTSFHGGWSLAGFAGALLGMVMQNLHIVPYRHYWIVTVIIILIEIFNFKYLLATKPAATAGGTGSKKKFPKPEKLLLVLGFMGFCSMASEGAMYDWSGVYFQNVVQAPESIRTLGYVCFMTCMSAGRFTADGLISRIGRKKVLLAAGMLMSIGFYCAVIVPTLLPNGSIRYILSCLSFMLIGLGVCSVVPSAYSIAGAKSKIPPGEAITVVSSISFLGFVLGPPFIGHIAQLFHSLKYSYAIIGILGILIVWIVRKMDIN